MGIIIHLKDKNVFKQGNKVSRDPVYPMFFKELRVINYEYIGEIGKI